MRKSIAIGILILAAALHSGGPAAGENNTAALMNRAIQLSIKGDLKEARKIFQGILKKEPNNMFAHNNLGKIYFDQKELDLALASYRKALDIDPGFLMAQNNIAAVYKETGDYAKAESILKKTLKRFPSFELANANLGEIYLAQKRYDEAAAYFQKAVDSVPWVAQYHRLLAEAFEGRHMDAEAQKELDIYHRLKTNKP